MMYLLRNYDEANGICSCKVAAPAENAESLLAVGYVEVSQSVYDAVKVSNHTQSDNPTQLDIIESQVTYTAMMTDTLLEV